jgi:hypothetical protein
VWRRTMSVKCRRAQANALRSLAIEAYQPKLFEEDVTAKEAAKRIGALRQEIDLADSSVEGEDRDELLRRLK